MKKVESKSERFAMDQQIILERIDTEVTNSAKKSELHNLAKKAKSDATLKAICLALNLNVGGFGTIQ